MISFSRNIPTSGQGLWSSRVATVETTYLDLAYVNKEKTFGELRVFFNKNSWNAKEDGLIYTDPLFEKILELELEKLEVSGSISYSEQGMQGKDYVSFDVDAEFISSWIMSTENQELYPYFY